MAKIERFEDIKAWQKARELVNEIYSVTNDGRFAKDFGLREQIRRACSINYAKHRRRICQKNK